MSDKTPAAAKPAGPPSTPAVRRISQPRPRKSPAKPASSDATEAAPAPAVAPRGEDRPPASAAVDAAPGTSHQEPVTDAWPEPEAPISGGHAASDAKRKRRRRKGKGQSAQPHAAAASTEENLSSDDAVEHLAVVATAPPAAPRHPEAPQSPPRPPAPRAKMDPETLANKAWKIFLAEVSEEGVALIGDQDARELARRCFRLAEIFIEEQARRAPNAP